MKLYKQYDIMEMPNGTSVVSFGKMREGFTVPEMTVAQILPNENQAREWINRNPR